MDTNTKSPPKKPEISRCSTISRPRELIVTGTFWSGAHGSYPYDLKHDQIVNTLAEAKRVAVDFESLDSARVVQYTKWVQTTAETTKIES